jgi:Asp-tRNA(Asn)/Glu-tRNA(Gln) amidotransferase A subunit family amidase
VGAERVLQAQTVAQWARKLGTDAIAHGSTAAGNDQVRFELTVMALNPKLNAFITTTSEQALEAARASDARRKRGEAGPLEGIPLAIKDLFCTEAVRTTAGSKILGNFIPPYESTVTAQLKRDGAVFVGKANLDEFAMGSSNLTSAYGGVLNPWQRKDDPSARLVPGGSSGGSRQSSPSRCPAPWPPVRSRWWRTRPSGFTASRGCKGPSAAHRPQARSGWPLNRWRAPPSVHIKPLRCM